MRGLYLLTAKPMVYAANVAEEDLAQPDANKHVQVGEGQHQAFSSNLCNGRPAAPAACWPLALKQWRQRGAAAWWHARLLPLSAWLRSACPALPSQALKAKAAEEDSGVVVVSAQVEAELNGLDKEEAAEYLEALGVEEGGLKNLIRWVRQRVKVVVLLLPEAAGWGGKRGSWEALLVGDGSLKGLIRRVGGGAAGGRAWEEMGGHACARARPLAGQGSGQRRRRQPAPPRRPRAAGLMPSPPPHTHPPTPPHPGSSPACDSESYKQLGLLTYFTSGEKETRAWTVAVGSTAPQAAGVIHTGALGRGGRGVAAGLGAGVRRRTPPPRPPPRPPTHPPSPPPSPLELTPASCLSGAPPQTTADFEKGFIRAETVAFKDFITVGGLGPAKEKGLLRLEGKEYVVKGERPPCCTTCVPLCQGRTRAAPRAKC